jgi:hypothetical protein
MRVNPLLSLFERFELAQLSAHANKLTQSADKMMFECRVGRNSARLPDRSTHAGTRSSRSATNTSGESRMDRARQPGFKRDTQQLARDRVARLLAGRGAIAQTVWNSLFGFRPEHGLRDLDLVYFDEADVSETQEHRHVERIRGLFRDCGPKIDVKNEARVHLWYEAKFGKLIPPYRSTAHAIATFPTTATTVGVCPDSSGLRIEAAYGLADLTVPYIIRDAGERLLPE